jgi:5'-methylthioadenosine phosphorylase
MGRLAVILGSNALGPGGGEIAAAATEHGAAVVQRHGAADEYVLPHEIDHAANLRPLVEQGVDRVLAIASVGSLRTDLPVGSLVCPDDFIAPQVGASIFVDTRAHTAPAFAARWRGELLAAWAASIDEAPVDGGVYWQTIGPRFETPAEIRMIVPHADLVGMTIASECVIAGELGLEYAAICVVDNLANGLDEGQLSVEEMEADRLIHAATLRDGLAAVLPRLGVIGR